MGSGVRVLSGALLALVAAGCDGPAPSGAGQTDGGPSDVAASASAPGAPDAPPGVVLSDARIQLPVIAGRPGVAYLTISQGSGPDRAIAAVHVAGAGRSEMHATTRQGGVSRMAPVSAITLAAGKPVRFAPGGYHVMLFELDPALKAGTRGEVTVVFGDGNKASIAAPVTGPGERSLAANP